MELCVHIPYQDMMSHGTKSGGWWEVCLTDDANHRLMELLLGTVIKGASQFRKLIGSLSLPCWHHHSPQGDFG